jgi:hypothetical protein
MKQISVLAVAFGLVGLGFGQNLVVNGDFSVSVPNSGTGGGWTAANNDGSGGWRSTGGNPGGTYILNDNGNQSSNPYIEQVIAVVSGTQYTIAGDYARGNGASGGNLDFAVQIDGNLWQYGIPTSFGVFNSFSETFIATSNSVTLRLSGEWAGDSDPRVDNISLEAVPEPMTIIALAGGAAVILKRRKRS